MADFSTVKKTYRINSSDICFFKFILESYDGMGQLTTIDPQLGLIEIRVAPGFDEDFQGLIEDLKKRMRIEAWTQNRI